MHALVAGDLDEIGMEVPGVDDHPARAGIAQQLGDLDVVGFGLRERVVQHHVDTVADRGVRVDLSDDHPIAVVVEEMGEALQYDVVVVDESDRDGPGGKGHASAFHPQGCYATP